MALLARVEDQKSGFGSVTLASTLASRLRSAIVTGQLAPGEKLRIDHLRDQFGVSLSPLREALSRLGSEGLVLIEEQRGYRVPPVSEDDQRNITQMRSEFEIYALRQSIAKGDITWEAEVTAALYKLNRIDRKKPEDIEKWEVAHREFHLKLISACGVPLLMQFCAALHDHSDRYRRLFLKVRPSDQRVPSEHKQITDAALAKKADVACDLLRKHIARAGANALEGLKAANVPIR